MLIAFLTWWYDEGWARQFDTVMARLGRLADMFSIELLLRTLFAPFRQISAGRVDGPLAVQMRAWFDRLISRFIGGLIRITVLFIGVIALFVAGLFGIIEMVLWPLVPLLPLAGGVLMLSGWLPWK